MCLNKILTQYNHTYGTNHLKSSPDRRSWEAVQVIFVDVRPG